MISERWRKIEEIYNAAAELPPGDRERHLDTACDGDTSLRRELENLLAFDEETGAGLDRELEDTIRGQAEELARDESEPVVGRRFGAYRVIGIIAHGGMGIVYRAVRDDEQFEKQVAIKILRRGMGADAVARFARERHILARLDHPNIARLLDGGTTGSGMQYVVMEYVEGSPVTEYCALHQLTTRKRLDLFRQICAAVQDAHRKLVVHRDIKPSNILVTAEGVPKLLDFGIAKLIDDDLPEQTIALRLLTPDYASPEQVKGGAITTATDIYSLGVVLYELISGHRAHRFTNRTTAEMEKVVCTVEPEPIPGELGSIVQKAMQKEPERRYETVEQLAVDVGRYLAGQPVAARPDTMWYRSRKFVARNRIAVAVSALAVLALVFATTAAVIQARRAQVRFQQLQKLANAVVLNPALFRGSGTLRNEERLLKTVIQYLDNLSRDSGEDPAVEHARARAYQTVQQLQEFAPRGMREPKAAAESNRKKLEIYERLLARNPNDETARLGLVQAYADIRTIESCRKSIQIAARLAGKLQFRYVLVSPYLYMARLQLEAGDPRAALATVAAAEERGLRRDALLLGIKAQALSAIGDLHAALAQTEAARSTLTSLTTTGPQVTRFAAALPHFNFAAILGDPMALNLGDRSAALAHYREAVRLLQEVAQLNPRDADRSWLAKAQMGVGIMLLESDPERALEQFRTALPAVEEKDRARCHALIGSALRRLHRAAEALPELQKSCDLTPSVVAWNETGDALRALGQTAAADQSYRHGIALAESEVKAKPYNMPSHRDLADAYERLAQFHAASHHPDDAHAWWEKSLAVWRDWSRWGVSSEFDQRRRAAAERAVKKYVGFARVNSPE
jgi:eukaryotic-like serine/threonine-protein kinase